MRLDLPMLKVRTMTAFGANAYSSRTPATNAKTSQEPAPVKMKQTERPILLLSCLQIVEPFDSGERWSGEAAALPDHLESSLPAVVL